MACAPLRSSGTNGISNQEGAYSEQENRDITSGSGCIESRWDQLGRCDRDSECCSKKCNIFRNSAYHCEPSTQNGVSGTEGTGQIRGGCIQDGAKCGPGNDNCCNARSTCHAVPYGFKDGNYLYGLRCASPRNQEGTYAEEGSIDLTSGSGCIESRWDQLSRCHQIQNAVQRNAMYSKIWRNIADHLLKMEYLVPKKQDKYEEDAFKMGL